MTTNLKSENKQKRPLYITYAGPTLLNTPMLNKGSAFSQYEREVFNLHGLIPDAIEDIEAQAKRCYKQYCDFISDMSKHVYLRNIQDTNETLFYKLMSDHLEEMMPIIYTPVVGKACQQFSEIYRKARGLFLCYDDINHLDDMMMNLTKQKIKIFVITDGERILGLGDQGIGGMGIPIGKLSLYTSCGGISPAYTAPICLDVGTNNEHLLADSLYMGKQHPRIDDTSYYEFLDHVINAVYRYFPNVLVQFEDFAGYKARPILDKYKNKICCFNDDIQGTAAVTLATLISACKIKNKLLKDQKILFIGAGSAGVGIASQIIKKLIEDGLSKEQAFKMIYLIDKTGLLCKTNAGEFDFQKPFIRKDNIASWNIEGEVPNTYETIVNGEITTIVGVSGVRGLITEPMVKKMLNFTARPIIFPLSNPTSKMEVHPRYLIEWTNGMAICSTGSPITPVKYKGKYYPISQCNNIYIFPGIGLAVISAEISRITDEMLMACTNTLAESSPPFIKDAGLNKKSKEKEKQFLPLLPSLSEIHKISKKIAFNVAKCAMKQGFAKKQSDESLKAKIEAKFWKPEYRNYRRYTL